MVSKHLIYPNKLFITIRTERQSTEGSALLYPFCFHGPRPRRRRPCTALPPPAAVTAAAPNLRAGGDGGGGGGGEGVGSGGSGGGGGGEGRGNYWVRDTSEKSQTMSFLR